MKLLIKQRVFSWTDTYDVYDEYGNPKYFVKGEFLSIGHKIHIYRHDTGLSVIEIAESVGYEDSQYFFRVFKKTTGVTPLQYRQQCRSGKPM